MKKEIRLLKGFVLRAIILGAMLVQPSLGVFAQTAGEDADEELIKRPVQVTFVHPVGSNGLDAYRTVNQLSINILAGVQGGLDGVEMGGLLNVDRLDVRGAQFAGVGNFAGGNTDAVQFAGFMNASGGYMRGGQFSGFMNLSGAEMTGIQAAGFMNLAGGPADGAQLAGFINTAQSVNGGQVAGFMNVAQAIDGAQVAGFMNVAKNVKGVQIAGFLNLAQSLNGTQLGFINLVDTLEKGTPIGFLSVVGKNGYRSFQIGASEALYLTASFRMGTRKFYNIFALGARNDSEVFTWAYGYGAGTQWALSPKNTIGIEAVAYHLNEDEIWTNRLNMLNRVSLPITFALSNRTSLVLAPSLNVTVRKRSDAEGSKFGADIAPYTFYGHTTRNHQVQMWAGLEAGIRF